MLKFVLVCIIVLLSANVSEAQPKRSLRGSKSVQRQQNIQADKEKLSRLKDDKELARFVKAGLLVPLPENQFVEVDSRLEPQYRYCRPWTRDFLNKLGKDHALEFGTANKIRINSAVRSEVYQKSLRKRNGNAAKTAGPRASSHLRGSTVDIAKKNLNPAEIRWLRNYLLKRKVSSQLIAIEEFRQSVFHVMVFKPTPAKKTKRK